MIGRSIITVLVAVSTQLANASEDRSWPWVVFGPRIDSCAQLDDPMRRQLSNGLAKASKSTKELLPSRIWRTYEQQVSNNTGTKQASSGTRVQCEALLVELEAENLSASLRGQFFLGMLQGAPFDCMLDDSDKGKTFLIEFRKFFNRNGLLFPEETVDRQLAKMRAENWKVLNGWNTPHCRDLQRSLSSGELDPLVTEDMMRKNLFTR